MALMAVTYDAASVAMVSVAAVMANEGKSNRDTPNNNLREIL
jgi:hypothetical protein